MTAPALPSVFGALAPALDHYGYLAVAGFIFLEDFGVPVPGETILLAGAVYAGAGKLNVVALGLLALAAAVAGDNVGFVIGHFGGRPLVLKWGRYVFLTPTRLDTAQKFFQRHGGKVVTVARFIEGLRQANGIVAGVSQMPWLRFLTFNTLGAALWCGVWITAGYLAGNRIDVLYRDVNHYEIYIGIALGVLALAYLARQTYQHRKNTTTARPS